MQLIHAQHQAKTLSRASGEPMAVILEGRDYMPVSLDECDHSNLDYCFIAYPSGKTEVIQ